MNWKNQTRADLCARQKQKHSRGNEGPIHKQIKDLLLQLGNSLGYETEEEFWLRDEPVWSHSQRIDVVWWTQNLKPAHAFEITTSENYSRPLTSLVIAKGEGFVPHEIVINKKGEVRIGGVD